MRVFVTGGSGFVGGHLIEGLLAAGHEVWAMARSERSREVVERYGATAVSADLDSVGPEHLAGIEVVVHAAAEVAETGPWERFYRGNVLGTERMLAAARSAGVGRFLFIGTEAAVFDGRDLVEADERQPYPDPHPFVYGATKALAEQRVLAANSPEFVTLSLRPRLIWGPRDATVLPEILRAAREGRFAWIGGGQALTSTTHVANLVDAVLAALTRGRGGEAYFVVDEGTRTYREFLSALAATRGVTLPDRSVPGWLVRPLSRLIERSWLLLGLQSKPPMGAMSVHMLGATMTFRSDKARRELGWSPRVSVEQGLAELRGSSGPPAEAEPGHGEVPSPTRRELSLRAG